MDSVAGSSGRNSMRLSIAELADKLYFYSFLLVGLVGLLSPFEYNVLPANAIFEMVLLMCALLVFRIPKRPLIGFFAAAILYVGISYALMTFSMPAGFLDFAQAYKAFFYIVPLCVFFRRNVFSRERAVRLVKLLLVIMFLKYAYSALLDLTPRMGSRPGLYVENNFEIIFLVIVFYVLRDDLGPKWAVWFGVLAAVIGLSGSRSSMLALLMLYCGIFLNRLTLRTFFHVAGLAVLALVAASIFAFRSDGGGVESIDRYNFMMVFASEVEYWPAWKFLFGSAPLTPLSSYACSSLVYYQELFSFTGDGRCYSVILHSYFLRAIFDHGVLGLLFLLGFLARALRGSGYSTIEVLVFLGIICSSALSVSAMNSVFVSLAIALALGVRRRKDPPRICSSVNFSRRDTDERGDRRGDQELDGPA
ncbi:MAG: hypothetical protein ACREP4_01885 [Stenotrophomonas sp.]|uniref:hypothetical protein n=1 Tax=Stenotrophomonas sp. TaxID=69392 RepID=UPI003D6D37D6